MGLDRQAERGTTVRLRFSLASDAVDAAAEKPASLRETPPCSGFEASGMLGGQAA